MTVRDFLFDCLSFSVSHIFLWPILALIPQYVLVNWLGTTGWAIVVAFNAFYFSTYLGDARKTGKRFSAWFCKMWLGCHQYFPVKTLMWDGERYADEPNAGHDKVFNVKEQTFVFAMHPHGAIPVGGAVFRPQISRWKDINENLRVGVASIVLTLPFVRDFFLWFGSVDVSKSTLEYQLRHGKSVMLLPGGIREQLWVCKPDEDVVLLRRKGFVKLALESGSPLVPVYVFGERKGYVVMEKATRLLSRVLKNVFNAGVPFVRGRWFTLMPFPTPITIVIGKPIPVPQKAKDEITNEDVDVLHATYTKALIDLYEEHKIACGYGDIKLKIV